MVCELNGIIAEPGSSDSKESACNARKLGSIPGLGQSPEKEMTTLVFLPGKSHGWRSLVGYSQWGHKESYTTEGLHFHKFVKGLTSWWFSDQCHSMCLGNFRNRGMILNSVKHYLLGKKEV